MGRRTNTAVWLEDYKRWQIKVQKDGKRRTFTSSTPGRTGQREANAKADAWLDEGVTNPNAKVRDIYPLWIQEKKDTTGRGNYEAIEYRFEKWVIPRIGHKKISSLTDQNLLDILNEALKQGLAKKSISNILADIKSFLRYCRRSRITTYNPEDVTVPKGARSKEKDVLQPDDLKRLFTLDQTILYKKRVFDDYIYAYRFQTTTGLRPGELRGLTWADIDLKNEIIYIKRAINRYNETTSGKNENAIRSFALNKVTAKILRQQRALFLPGDRVFPISSTANYWSRLQRFCSVNDIKAIAPYELRHTFVSAVKSLPEAQVKELVGHSKNMDTFGIYGHSYSGDKERTGSAVEEVFLGILGSGL